MEEEWHKRNITKIEVEELKEILHEQIQNTSYYFGDPHLNVATLAGIYRMTLKEYDKRHGLETKKEIKPHINSGEYL